jgi:uncharacterized protein DUF4253
MARARATVTLQESADGEVSVLVQTRQPLLPYKVLDRQWEPQQYLNDEHNPGSVELTCSLEVDSGLWLPQLRASTPFWIVDRYLDITAGSEERRLLERMIGQADFEIAWANEDTRARRAVHERTRDVLEQTFTGFPELDPATWREAVAESEWRGSQNWRPGPRPRKPKRRTARPPADVELRYFAVRTGALPREGAARVAGIKLPRGRRFGGFWCSDEEVDEAIELASALANEFTATGLWPLLWAYPEEPTGYMSGLADLEWIEGREAATIVEREWAAHALGPEWVEPFGTAFPGLAPPIDRELGMRFEPFEALKAHRIGMREPLSARLLVVPCNRPADAVAAVGFGGFEFSGDDLSAIVRSWEERFGAVLTTLNPARIHLCVEGPPRTFVSALRVAAEHFAVAPDSEAGESGTLVARALVLQGNPIWELSWRS